MKMFLSLVHIVLCVILTVVVLLQRRKQGGFGGAFGGAFVKGPGQGQRLDAEQINISLVVFGKGIFPDATIVQGGLILVCRFHELNRHISA